jgi:hypothetical protein
MCSPTYEMLINLVKLHKYFKIFKVFNNVFTLLPTEVELHIYKRLATMYDLIQKFQGVFEGIYL